ncbi:cell wall-binding protein [Acetobacteraceae bacterium H6797]|nr:cell wall-binding protein [Acetobacteraceae bacterium H6797]
MSEGLAAIRACYEAAVRRLGETARVRLEAGESAEAVARAVHAERRALAEAFKAVTPEPWRGRLLARNQALYGDPMGLGIGFLRGKGKSWEEIVEGAARPGLPPVDGCAFGGGSDDGGDIGRIP